MLGKQPDRRSDLYLQYDRDAVLVHAGALNPSKHFHSPNCDTLKHVIGFGPGLFDAAGTSTLPNYSPKLSQVVQAGCEGVCVMAAPGTLCHAMDHGGPS